MSYNPAKAVMSQIIGKCYELDTSLSEVAEKCNYSISTASNDKNNPEKIPLSRLIMYMTALKIDNLEINL